MSRRRAGEPGTNTLFSENLGKLTQSVSPAFAEEDSEVKVIRLVVSFILLQDFFKKYCYINPWNFHDGRPCHEHSLEVVILKCWN